MEPTPAIERWDARDDGRVCAGFGYLRNRVFVVGEGPRPPLYGGCRCRRVAVDVLAFSGAALIALVLRARRNGSRGENLGDEAKERRLNEEGRLHGGSRLRRRTERRAVRRVERQEGVRE